MQNTIGNGQYVETLVKSLKASGFSISTIHWRKVRAKLNLFNADGSKAKGYYTSFTMPLFEIRRKGLVGDIEARGGYTTVRIMNPKTKVDVIGESICSDMDSFQNKLGFRRSLAEACKELNALGVKILENKE